MIKRILSSIVFSLLGVWLLVWTIRFVGWHNIVSAFSIFNCWSGLATVLLGFLILVVGCWKWQVILKHQGYNLSFIHLIGPYVAYFSLTYLFPFILVGGEVFRSYFLKERHGVPWDKAVSSIIIDKILETTISLVAILAGLAVFLLKIGLPPRNLSLIFAAVVLFIGIGIGFFYYITFARKSVAKYIVKFLKGKGLPDADIINIEKETFQFFRSKKKALLEVLGLSFLRVFITGVWCWAIIFFLGKSVGIVASLSILSFYYLGLMVPIPASIGAYEIIQAFSFDSLGLGVSLGPAFSMIQRASELVICFGGLIIFFKLGLGLFQSSLVKKIEKLFNK
jgi:uncharacterized protein (TIRG00374 family)